MGYAAAAYPARGQGEGVGIVDLRTRSPARVRVRAQMRVICSVGDVLVELVRDAMRCVEGAMWFCAFIGGDVIVLYFFR